MFGKIWTKLFRMNSTSAQKLAELENLYANEDDDDEERTVMVDTLAYTTRFNK